MKRSKKRSRARVSTFDVDESPENQKLRRLARVIEKQASDVLSKHLTALIGRQLASVNPKRPPTQYGSGMLLQIGNAHFLITAAHVSQQLSRLAKEFDSPTWLMTGINENEMVKLDGIPEGVIATDENLDVCALRLSDSEAAALKNGGSRFLRLNQVNPWDEPQRPCWYVIIGFPACNQQSIDEGWHNSKHRFVIDSTGLTYVTHSYEDTKRVSEYRPRQHIVLHFGGGRSFDSTGQPMVLPNPQGMSGCGVWRITKDLKSMFSLDEHTLSLDATAQLAGIEFCRNHDEGYLKVTKMHVILRMIKCRWPELSRSVSISFTPPAPPVIAIASPKRLWYPRQQ